MAQAIATPSISLTISEAAAEIVRLVNGCPRTPWPQEIEAIVARVSPQGDRMGAPQETIEAFAEWRACLTKWRRVFDATCDLEPNHPDADAAEAAVDAMEQKLDACTQRIWAMPARTWADVALRALIYAQNTDEIERGKWFCTDLAAMEENYERSNPTNDLRSRAFLLDAIFKVAGIVLPDLSDTPDGVPPDWSDYMAAGFRVAALELAGPPVDCYDDAPAVDRAARRKLVEEAEATLVSKDVPCGDPREAELQAVCDAAFERLNTFHRAIWARPARSIADIHFLADLVVYQLWCGQSLTGPFPGSDPRTLESLCEEGPDSEGDTVDMAIGALLRAIRDVIGPQQPLGQDDAALLRTVRTAIARQDEAERLSIKLDDDDEQAIQACKERWQDLWAAQDQIPNPPRSPLHVLLQAEIAYHGADKTRDNRLAGHSSDDCFERPATRLIESVISYFGGHAHG